MKKIFKVIILIQILLLPAISYAKTLTTDITDNNNWNTISKYKNIDNLEYYSKDNNIELYVYKIYDKELKSNNKFLYDDYSEEELNNLLTDNATNNLAKKYSIKTINKVKYMYFEIDNNIEYETVYNNSVYTFKFIVDNANNETVTKCNNYMQNISYNKEKINFFFVIEIIILIILTISVIILLIKRRKK